MCEVCDMYELNSISLDYPKYAESKPNQEKLDSDISSWEIRDEDMFDGFIKSFEFGSKFGSRINK